MDGSISSMPITRRTAYQPRDRGASDHDGTMIKKEKNTEQGRSVFFSSIRNV